jgi:hypothetical protein
MVKPIDEEDEQQVFAKIMYEYIYDHLKAISSRNGKILRTDIMRVVGELEYLKTFLLDGTLQQTKDAGKD